MVSQHVLFGGLPFVPSFLVPYCLETQLKRECPINVLTEPAFVKETIKRVRRTEFSTAVSTFLCYEIGASLTIAQIYSIGPIWGVLYEIFLK